MGYKIRKEEIKAPLFSDDKILSARDLKEFTRKYLDLIKTFIKETGYQISIKQ